MQEDNYEVNVQLTLEKHLKNLSEVEEGIRYLSNLWELLRVSLVSRLQDSRSVFVDYSLHDSSHSRTVISAIEMFLGEDRIRRLSATDTFMLLCCAYAHDYGMAVTIDKIYKLMNSEEFETYIESEYEEGDPDKRELLGMLLKIIRGQYQNMKLGDVYMALNIVLEDYMRPKHWEGVEDIEGDFEGLFAGRLKIRLIKSVIQICQLHAAKPKDVMNLERYAQGAVSDIYHPRFVAFMLRLGDLLDLDNSRFPEWFVRTAFRTDSKIPELSKLHYQKHESISHLYIGPKRLQVVARCHGEDASQVAYLVDRWLYMLDCECDFVTKQWAEIAPMDFGRPPCLQKKDIYIQTDPAAGYEIYGNSEHDLQMQMPQERVLSLLEGTNIYNDRYVGIRELVQNAVDASLLQMWYDITHNKYASYGIQKNEAEEKVKKKKWSLIDIPKEIFRFYDIRIELLRDYNDKEIYVVIKDKGIGIGRDDVEYMANIGESKEKNKRIRSLVKNMPNWLKPAGIFGIGLQSVFQLTDRIEFYSRRPNQPELKIVFYSLGKNKGRIEVRELHEGEDHIFYDNYMQGTNVKFAINREKLWAQKEKLLYYDPQFDEDEMFEAAFVEMAHVITAKLEENPFDYFNVSFQTLTLSGPEVEKKRALPKVYSFFNPPENYGVKNEKFKLSAMPFLDLERQEAPEHPNRLYKVQALNGDDRFHKPGKRENSDPFAVDVANHSVYHFDSQDSIYYRLDIVPCAEVRCQEESRRKEMVCFRLPEPAAEPFHVWYKFTEITDISVLLGAGMTGNENAACSSLVRLYIIIFDSPANAYLNIDRNCLKEQDKLEPEAVEKAQKLLCEHLCEKILQSPRAAAEFIQKPENAVTLLFLFCNYLDSDLYAKFWKRVKDEMEGQKKEWLIELGEAYLPVKDLEGRDKVFTLKYPVAFAFPSDRMAEESGGETVRVWKAGQLNRYAPLSVIERQIPLRYFHIRSIETVCGEDGSYYFCYKVALKRNLRSGERHEDVSAGMVGMDMDEGARLADYCRGFSPHSYKEDIDYETLIRMVFKPDLRYKDIIVTRRPRSFRLGKNMINDLELSLDAFILSPFDKQTAKVVRKYVESGDDSEEWVVSAVKKSAHFQKCKDYIRKFHYTKSAVMGDGDGCCEKKAEKEGQEDKENEKQKLYEDGVIVRAYERFIRDFCKKLRVYQGWVRELVLDKGAGEKG